MARSGFCPGLRAQTVTRGGGLVKAALVATGIKLLTGCATVPAQASFHQETAAGQNSPPSHAEPELLQHVHLVEAGQTLYGIAKGYGISVPELMAENGLTPQKAIEVGQTLLIPERARPKAPSRDSAAGPASAGNPPSPRPSASAHPVATGTAVGVLDWPLRGILYARFGRKGAQPHDGLDLAAPVGTLVKTAGPGRVLYAGEQRGYGFTVIIEHGDGLVTVYAHNREVRVKTGEQVRAAQVIATVGESGRTSGPHLHFEVRKEGTPVDPLRYLRVPPSA